MPSACASSVLDAETSQFLQRRVSIIAASRDAENRPFCARAYGCRAGAGDRTLTVFVQRPQAARLLSDVECNGHIAVVFSRPTTHWALQLKGHDARVGALQPGDAQLVAEWVGSLVVEVTPLGFTAPFIHAVCATRPDEMAAITFTPSEGFAQTPGPGAGARLSRAEAPADIERRPL
jgi:hypothetical protein